MFYELEPKDYFPSNEEGALYTVNTSEKVLRRFGKVILSLGIVVLSNTASANNYSFDLQESAICDCCICDSNSNISPLNSFEQYLNIDINRYSLNVDVEKIKSYPSSWWNKFDADKPEDITFSNTVCFLDVNANDTLLRNAEILPKRNGTLLIEWNTGDFMCSVNIGEDEFSYSILPFNGEQPLLGQASIKDENKIRVFFNQLEVFYA